MTEIYFFSNHQKIIDIATKTNPFKCDTERKFSLTFSIKISPEIFFSFGFGEGRSN